MAAQSVHTLLLQGFHADKSAARLLHTLNELAGRLEAAESSSIEAAWRLHGSSVKCNDPSNLPLPDPAQGPLPLFPGACEHQAMQEAAEASSRTLSSTAERRAWRSWVLSPQHMVHVVEAAWLLLAMVFRQEDVCAAALQAYVCREVQHHHVSSVLSGQVVPDSSQLWSTTLADAACRLLRAAFPDALELQDGQLMQVLQRQLRLFITGLLPSDAAAPALLSKQQQPWAAKKPQPELATHDAEAVADLAAGCDTSQEDRNQHDEQGPQHGGPKRRTAHFMSVKPGPAVSAFMAHQGLQPAPDLLQSHAGELTRITLPAQLVQQQQQQQDEIAAASRAAHLDATAALHNRLVSTVGSSTAAGSSSSSSTRLKAAACMAAATKALETYERHKAAAAASIRAGCLSAQVQVQALQRQRTKAIAAGPSKAKDTSNRVSGWLSEAGAATLCIATKPLTAVPALSARSTPTSTASVSKATSNTDTSSIAPLATDMHCKAQRHMLEGQLRAGDWRMAHVFNAALHDKCTNMAAAVATRPPAPVTPMPTSSGGQDWGALVSTSVARSHVKGGCAGARYATGGNIKVMKAARAIVEDVQRAFAASSSAPFGTKH